MGFVILISFKLKKEIGLMVRIKNVGRVETIFRSVIGIMLIVLAFLISGIFQWIVGLIGVVFILTALFGY